MASGDEFKTVQSGDPLRIPAATYNAFIAAANAYRSLRHGTPGQEQTARDWLPLKNDSGEDVATGYVVSIGASGTFDKPSGPPYGITKEPIADGLVGQVAFTGGPHILRSRVFGGGRRHGPVPGEWWAKEGPGPWINIRGSFAANPEPTAGAAGSMSGAIICNVVWENVGRQDGIGMALRGSYHVYRELTQILVVKGMTVSRAYPGGVKIET